MIATSLSWEFSEDKIKYIVYLASEWLRKCLRTWSMLLIEGSNNEACKIVQKLFSLQQFVSFLYTQPAGTGPAKLYWSPHPNIHHVIAAGWTKTAEDGSRRIDWSSLTEPRFMESWTCFLMKLLREWNIAWQTISKMLCQILGGVEWKEYSKHVLDFTAL